MKKAYIILSYTGTMLSQIIKQFTKDEYAHISISLDETLNEMYSFGRLNPYNPFWGGFVKEGINTGTFKRFWKTKIRVYSIYITDEQCEKIKKIIEYFQQNKEKYKFNFIGLACVGINIRFMKKNQFYCAEFVKHILKSSGVVQVNKLPELIRPEDFKMLENAMTEYEGPLRNYKK